MINALLTVVNTLLVLWWTPSSYWIIILSIPVTKSCYDSCHSCGHEKSMLSPLSLKLGRSGIIVISNAEMGLVFEPGTSRTLSENYTPKPISLVSLVGSSHFSGAKKKCLFHRYNFFAKSFIGGVLFCIFPLFSECLLLRFCDQPPAIFKEQFRFVNRPLAHGKGK